MSHSYTVILDEHIVDNVPARTAVVDAVRQTAGVLSLDTEMVEDGLLFVKLQTANVVINLERIDGITKVSRNGVKSAL